MTVALINNEHHAGALHADAQRGNRSSNVSADAFAERVSPQELRRYLADALQGTLEISTLQQRLLKTLTHRLELDGLHYHHAALALDIRVGTQAPHSCGYRLLTSEEYLGEIIFKRARQFSEHELELIEAAIPAMVDPLRSSLRNR